MCIETASAVALLLSRHLRSVGVCENPRGEARWSAIDYGIFTRTWSVVLANGHGQESAEVKWTIRDRVNILTLKINSIRAGLPPLDETERTTAIVQSVAGTGKEREAVPLQTEDVTALAVTA